MAIDHFIRETRYYRDGRIRITYWCGKKEIVEADEPLEVDKAKSRHGRRAKTDCAQCAKASGWA
jgi:hypothetical protein